MSKLPNPELIDDENPEWTDEMFAKAKKGATAGRVGRPKADVTKQSTTLRLDADVLEYFKRDGKGWQTRLNNALREYVEEHRG